MKAQKMRRDPKHLKMCILNVSKIPGTITSINKDINKLTITINNLQLITKLFMPLPRKFCGKLLCTDLYYLRK